MRQTAPFVGVPLELADGSPIRVVVESDQPGGSVQQVGWVNLQTGAFTAGPPPLGVRPVTTRGPRGFRGARGTGNGPVVLNILDFGAVRNPIAAGEATADGQYTAGGFPTFDSSQAYLDALAEARLRDAFAGEVGTACIYYPPGYYTGRIKAESYIKVLGSGISQTRIQVPSGTTAPAGFGDADDAVITTDRARSATPYLDGFELGGFTLVGRRTEGRTDRGVHLSGAASTIGQGHIPPVMRDLFIFNSGTESLFIADSAYNGGVLYNIYSFFAGRLGFWLGTDSIKLIDCNSGGCFGWANFLSDKGGCQYVNCKVEFTQASAVDAPIPDPSTDTPPRPDLNNVPSTPAAVAKGANAFVSVNFGLNQYEACACETIHGAGYARFGKAVGDSGDIRMSNVHRPVVLDAPASGPGGYSDLDIMLTALPSLSSGVEVAAEFGIGLSRTVGWGNRIRINVLHEADTTRYAPPITPEFEFVHEFDSHVSHMDRNEWTLDNLALRRVLSPGPSYAPDAFNGLDLSLLLTEGFTLDDVVDRRAVMPGAQMRITFQQDSAGGHNIVGAGSSYLTLPTIDTTANGISAVVFRNVSRNASPAWVVESTSAAVVPPAGLAPDAIAGLLQWNKADSIALVDGSAVASWPAEPGFGAALTQATVANQAILHLAALNGWPIVSYDGSNDFHSTAVQPAHAQPTTIILVGGWRDLTISPTAGQNQYAVGPALVDASHNYGILASVEASPAPPSQRFTVAGGAVAASPKIADAAPHMFEAILDPSGAASAKLFVDGVDVIPAGGNIGATGTYIGLTLGAGLRVGTTSPVTFAAVDIAEVAVYDHVLSVGDRRNLRLHFRNKYDLPITI